MILTVLLIKLITARIHMDIWVVYTCCRLYNLKCINSWWCKIVWIRRSSHWIWQKIKISQKITINFNTSDSPFQKRKTGVFVNSYVLSLHIISTVAMLYCLQGNWPSSSRFSAYICQECVIRWLLSITFLFFVYWFSIT